MKSVTLEELKAKRPGDPETIAAHRKRMLAEVYAYRLRELRERSLLTQTELADRLDVTQRRVSKIESGDIDHTQLDTLRRYAEALGGVLLVEVQLDGESYRIA